MQNKQISLKLFLASLLFGTGVMAQELDLLEETASKPEDENVAASVASDDSLADFTANMAQKKAVDFPPRSSLDSMELAPLPGIYETNVTGPQPMAESVSVNDTPSEQLLGRLTPEVFQEMAEMERDTAYLKLQVEKERQKNDLENVRAQYRQARLDEIQKREEVVRSRIQWWQEQEKLRQEVEKERQEAEGIKNQMDETEALKAQLANRAPEPDQDLDEMDEDLTPVASESAQYSLLDVKGTRGQLNARLKNTATEEITSVKVGDNLDGGVVTAITLEEVVLDNNGTELVIKFSS